MSEMRKMWKCKNGHALGSVGTNGSKVVQLYLFRQAIDMGDEHPEEVDVVAVVEGYVADVRCSVPGCGAVRTWVPGEAALRRLLSAMGQGRGDGRAVQH